MTQNPYAHPCPADKKYARVIVIDPTNRRIREAKISTHNSAGVINSAWEIIGNPPGLRRMNVAGIDGAVYTWGPPSFREMTDADPRATYVYEWEGGVIELHGPTLICSFGYDPVDFADNNTRIEDLEHRVFWTNER